MIADIDRTDEIWLPAEAFRWLAPEAAEVAEDHGAMRDGLIRISSFERLFSHVTSTAIARSVRACRLDEVIV